MKWLLVALMGLALAMLPSLAMAAGGSDDGGVLVRVRGDATITSGETMQTLVVVRGNAQIDGTVSQDVVVIDGNVVVNGTIEGSLTVVSGDIALNEGSSVDQLTSIRSNLTRAPGASVNTIRERDSFRLIGVAGGVFSLLFWVAMGVSVVIAGLLFAAAGGRQLAEAGRITTAEPLSTFLGAIALWVGVPVLAVLAIVTLIGVPFGIGLFVFLLPALWFLGYIVAGERIGSFIVRTTGQTERPHPFAATVLGLVLLQLIVLVPGLGAFCALLAGMWGAGALAVMAYRAAGGPGGLRRTPTLPAAGPQMQPTV